MAVSLCDESCESVDATDGILSPPDACRKEAAAAGEISDS
jgi:hypothetical protein